MMNQSPQTIGYALADSPVAMAAYYYDKIAEWTDSGGVPEKVFTYDEMLDAISRYWLTNTGASSSRSYLGRRPGRRRPVQRRTHPPPPGRGHRLPRPDLPRTPQLGRTHLRQHHPLERSRPRRPLRRLGTAHRPDQRTPQRLQATPLAAARPSSASSDCRQAGGADVLRGISCSTAVPRTPRPFRHSIDHEQLNEAGDPLQKIDLLSPRRDRGVWLRCVFLLGHQR